MDPLATLFERYRRQGDLNALGEVFDALAPRLLSVALHVCGNAADAEDVLQQTFLLAMEHDVGFDATRRLEPWFAGLLTNVARNARRHGERRRAAPLPELAGDDAGPIASAERTELVGLLRTHVDALPQEQRQVLRLQLQHGLSPADIAEAIEVPPGTVRMRIHRGLQALRKLLPASLAALLGASFASRGLASVRHAVLQAGRKKAAAAGVVSAAAIGGIVATKKIVTAGAVGLVMLLALWVWWNGAPATVAPSAWPQADAVPAVAALEAGTANDAAETPADAARVAAPEALGSLRVRVTARAAAYVVPIGGTLLEVWAGESPLAPFDGGVQRVTTDARGEVVLASLAPGPWHVHLIAERDAEPQRVQVNVGGETLLSMERAVPRVVRGIVVDVDGVPVPDAQVWAHRGTYMGRYSTPERGEIESRLAAISDAEGRFATPVMANEDRLGACRDGYGEARAAYAGTDDGVRLVLGRTFTSVRGTVLDANGAPLAGALVRLTPAGQDTRRAADGTLLAPRVDRLVRTDANGRFAFDGVAPGRVRVGASAWPLNPAWQELDAVAFVPADLQLALKGGVTVIGTVHWADGTPARVSMCSRPTLETDGHYCHCETREDGSYELYYQPKKRFYVVVGKWGPMRASREVNPTGSGVVCCDFVLEGASPAPDAVPPRTASVRGRFVDSHGSPIVRAAVLRRMHRENTGEPLAVAADGTFTLGALEAGEYEVAIDTGTPAARTLTQFELDAAEQRDLADLVVTPLTTLRVHVLRADGSPWRGPLPYVRLVDASGTNVDRPVEDIAGGVRLHVEPGNYTAHVLGTDVIAAPQPVELTVGVEAQITVRVAIGRSRMLVCNGDGAQKPKPGDVLHVTVRDTAGAVVVQHDVTMLYPDLRGFRYWYLDHAFGFGRYEVEAHSDSGLRYRGSFDVREDLEDPTRVDVPAVPQ